MISLGREDPERRAPEAGAPAGVELGALAVPAQPVHAPAGRAAPGSGTARSARRGCARRSAGRRRASTAPVDLLGLVGEQQHRQLRVGAGQRGGVVGAVARPGRSRPRCGRRRRPPPAGAPPRSTTRCRLCSGSQPSVAHVVEPALRLAEVLVVAGDVHPGQPGPDVAERRGLLRAAAATVPSAMSPVWHTMSASSALTASTTPARPARPVDRAVVGVGEQHHPHAVEAGAQPGERDVDPPDPGHPHRLDVPPDQQHRRDSRDRRPRRSASGAGSATPADRQREPQHVAQHRPDEQHPDHAEQGVAGDRPAQSRRRRPCPANISTGSASAAATNTTVPATTTAVGQCAPGQTSVHQGTPNSRASTAVSVAPNRRARRDRRVGAACAASVAVTFRA